MTQERHDHDAQARWVGIGILGAGAMAIIALANGETVNAAWLVIAALCTYFTAYRFYALFIARRVLRIDASRQTPAYRRNDGLGHHFAATAVDVREVKK